MQLTFSPVRTDETLTLARTGDVLTINGETLDLAALPDDTTLPQAAITGPGSEWIAGDIRRASGTLHVPLKLPHGWPAPQATLFPQPMTLVGNGPVDLPAPVISEE